MMLIFCLGNEMGGRQEGASDVQSYAHAFVVKGAGRKLCVYVIVIQFILQISYPWN